MIYRSSAFRTGAQGRGAVIFPARTVLFSLIVMLAAVSAGCLGPEAPVSDSMETSGLTDTPGLIVVNTPAPSWDTEEVAARRPAIPFSGQALDGSEFALSNTVGAPMLIAFWAPW